MRTAQTQEPPGASRKACPICRREFLPSADDRKKHDGRAIEFTTGYTVVNWWCKYKR